MTLLWLPDAARDERGGFAWQVSCPTKGVIHTTEGPSWSDYPPRYHPNATVKPIPGVGVQIRQHVPLNEASYALAHTAGTVATNGAHAIQFELVGTCDPHGPTGAYYWPDADDAVLTDLWRKVIQPVSAAYGIKLKAPTFRPYPASYGANGVRFTEKEWLNWDGWCGHQHVPGGNDHGDPGAFPWDRLVQIANHTEDDMSQADIDAINAHTDAAVAAALGGNKTVGSAVFAATFGKDPDGTARTAGELLLKAAQQPTAQDIAAAIVAQFKTLPAGTATVDDATIAKVAQATATELATRLVR
jgi:hypothetical protein